MEKELKTYLEGAIGKKITSAVPVSGGDISAAFKIQAGGDVLFCKYQRGVNGYSLLAAEKNGLEALGASGCIKTPKVLHLGEMENGGCLLLEYIQPKAATEIDMARFGDQLAQLHMVKAGAYGWEEDNFIGSLPQSNARSYSWAEFYASQRLMPQFKMALDNSWLTKTQIPSVTTLESRLEELGTKVAPSLIHGDLWGGNFLIGQNGDPYLIDPSVSYSHPGMDIAMSRLFGGFSESFYRSYGEASPYRLSGKAETELYQLYYLLVHLNIFGPSYASSVSGILRRYF